VETPGLSHFAPRSHFSPFLRTELPALTGVGMRRVVLVGLALMFAMGAGALALAPYLPDLITEGVPGVLYSGKGKYVVIGNSAPPSPLHISPEASTRALREPVATIFQAQKGEALLVFREDALVLEHYEGGAGLRNPL
jgi:hypothetical protein